MRTDDTVSSVVLPQRNTLKSWEAGRIGLPIFGKGFGLFGTTGFFLSGVAYDAAIFARHARTAWQASRRVPASGAGLDVFGRGPRRGEVPTWRSA